MSAAQIWLDGSWQVEAKPEGELQSYNPRTGQLLPPRFPISGAATLKALVRAGSAAAEAMRSVPPEQIAAFLERCASNLEAARDALVESAHLETGLPKEPRLRNVELPRTVDQLRQAAQAARQRSFCDVQIDTRLGLRSMRGPLGGPVAVFGPNNFPFAFNAVMGGDFAAALAAGNPVIAKAHPSQLSTTKLLAEAAFEALSATGLPPASVQLVYALPPELGLELVAHPDLGASAFTGSRVAGLRLKAAADRAGKPIYLELSAINPIFILPGALEERGTAIARELAGSATLGGGQFCTKPGLSILAASKAADEFVSELETALRAAPAATLLSAQGAAQIRESIALWTAQGARLRCGGNAVGAPAFGFEPTLVTATGKQWLEHPEALQKEAFGPVHLLVIATDTAELEAIASRVEGSLTGSIYTHTATEDDALYTRIAERLRSRVGRLLNDKMPTGVAVSAAMNHGGPYPATGHPGFTSVGIPSSIVRFTALHSYDAVRARRLPPELGDKNPTGSLWRRIDGEWSQSDVSPKAS
jgi:alpha-ketoglutaric semialdehyde dehydrogenase